MQTVSEILTIYIAMLIKYLISKSEQKYEKIQNIIES